MKYEKIKSFIMGAIGALVLVSVLGSTAYALSTFIVPQGGTGRSTLTASQLLYGNGTGAIGSVATSSVTISSPLTSGGTAGYVVGGSSWAIGIQNAAADGSTKGAASFTANDFDASSGNISIDYTNGQASSGSTKGFLTSADWTTFNGKESALTFNSPLSRSVNTISFLFNTANTWTGLNQFAANASSTQLSVYTNAWFGGTATSTFTSTGSLGIASSTPWSKVSVASGNAITVGENNLATSTSMTVNWNEGNQQLIRKGGVGITITFSNYVDGQTLRLIACNPAGTGGSLTFSTRVLWSAGTAPTQTTTANKCDIFSFIATKATSTIEILGAGSVNF